MVLPSSLLLTGAIFSDRCALPSGPGPLGLTSAICHFWVYNVLGPGGDSGLRCARGLRAGCRDREAAVHAARAEAAFRCSTRQHEVTGRQLCLLLRVRTSSRPWQPHVQRVTCLSVDMERGMERLPQGAWAQQVETAPWRGPCHCCADCEVRGKTLGRGLSQVPPDDAERSATRSRTRGAQTRGALGRPGLRLPAAPGCPSQACAIPRGPGLREKGRSHGESSHPRRAGDGPCQTQLRRPGLRAPLRDAQLPTWTPADVIGTRRSTHAWDQPAHVPSAASGTFLWTTAPQELQPLVLRPDQQRSLETEPFPSGERDGGLGKGQPRRPAPRGSKQGPAVQLTRSCLAPHGHLVGRLPLLAALRRARSPRQHLPAQRRWTRPVPGCGDAGPWGRSRVSLQPEDLTDPS